MNVLSNGHGYNLVVLSSGNNEVRVFYEHKIGSIIVFQMSGIRKNVGDRQIMY